MRRLRQRPHGRRRRAARHRFTWFWARLLVVFGFVAIGAGVVLAGFALFVEEWRAGVTGPQAALERMLVAGSLVLSGFLAGSPFIVFGQLLELFLQQRRLLERIYRVLRDRPIATAGPSPGAT